MSTATDPLAGLDADQREVATTFEVPVGVIAGAGSGKTRTIVHRIAHGVQQGAYEARSVLAVTFTTRAAAELRSRLGSLGVPGVQARTFHSAALRQAQYFWPRAYGSPLPPVSRQRLALMATAARQLGLELDGSGLRDLLSEVSWAKVSNVSARQYSEFAARAGREPAGLDLATVARALGRYDTVKAEQGVIDFDDILLCAAGLLGEREDIAAQVRQTYRHLVVDEYQDVNPLQQALLELWLGDSSDLCVVGDPAQTIHGFAGASADYLTGFDRRWPGARIFSLRQDYRSSPQVVALANAVGSAVPIPGRVELVSRAPDGPEPWILDCADESEEAAAVAAWLVNCHEDGVAWRDQAVLYRLHAQSPAIEEALAEAGIPFHVRAGEGFFERPEIRRVTSALAQAARRDPTTGAEDALAQVLHQAGWSSEPPAGKGRVREQWEAVASLASVVAQFQAEHPLTAGASGVAGGTVSALVTELDARRQAEDEPQVDGVTLTTLHASKGLEWVAVAVVGVQEGTLPLSHADTDDQLGEEGRLLYVGVTRAASRLLVTWVRTTRGGGRRGRSRFLGEPPLPPSARASAPRAAKVARSVLSASCRCCGGRLDSAAERKLMRHLECVPDYDPALLASLQQWRAGRAAERGLPAFCILTDTTLEGIAVARPTTAAALVALPGVGARRAAELTADVLAIVADHREAGPKASDPPRSG